MFRPRCRGGEVDVQTWSRGGGDRCSHLGARGGGRCSHLGARGGRCSDLVPGEGVDVQT